MLELDILGHTVNVPTSTIARLRDLAAAQAGRSNSARDLSLVLDRAVRTGVKVALQRGETRALRDLLDTPDPEFTQLAQALDQVSRN